MTTTETDQHVPAEPAESAEPALPTTLSKFDQMAWEAPKLRTTFVPDDELDPDWHTQCPDWCHGNAGHEAGRPMFARREHRSSTLRVRQDEALAYRDEEDGITIGHLECGLIMSSRSTTPQVQMHAHYGTSKDVGQERRFLLAPMYPDEVRELISVLQHLLKVGMES